MIASGTAGPTTSPDTLSELVNETLLLTAESRGLEPALGLRADLRAVALARAGRIVLAGEGGTGAIELLAGLLGAPRLPDSLSGVPRVRTTYRLGSTPSLTVTDIEGEREVGLLADGAPGGARERSRGVGVVPRRALQVEVALPSPFLSTFSVTHLPDLHAADGEADPVEAVTTGSITVFVCSASQPLSVAETRFLTRVIERTDRVAVVVTGVDTAPRGREVLAVDQVLLRRAGVWHTGRARLFAAGAGARPPQELDAWLDECASEAACEELLRLLYGGIERLLASQPADQAAERAAVERSRAAEADLRLATREAMSWLPRLGYEFTRLRAEVGETVARSLTTLEQRHDDWIQGDVGDAVERLPEVLVEDLRAVQRRADEEVTARLAVLAHDFLAGREEELVPGGLRAHVTSADPRAGLVSVAEVRPDASNELFASLGNFGSGRQSIGLLSSVVSAVAVPVALVGGVIGLGFWRLGRSSRQEGLARVQTSRWLKVQLAEAGRGTRFRLDQSLNEAQLVLNLAVREHHERLSQEAHAAVEAAHRGVAEAVARSQNEQARSAHRLERAQRLHDRWQDTIPGGQHA